MLGSQLRRSVLRGAARNAFRHPNVHNEYAHPPPFRIPTASFHSSSRRQDEVPKSPFQTFVDVLREELRKNRELQENVKQLQGDVDKFQDSEAMKRARAAYERARVRQNTWAFDGMMMMLKCHSERSSRLASKKIPDCEQLPKSSKRLVSRSVTPSQRHSKRWRRVNSCELYVLYAPTNMCVLKRRTFLDLESVCRGVVNDRVHHRTHQKHGSIQSSERNTRRCSG